MSLHLILILIHILFSLWKSTWYNFLPLLEWQDEQVTNVTNGATCAIRGSIPRDLCDSFRVLFLWDIS